MNTLRLTAMALVLAGSAAAQADDFRREGKDRTHKDALEGQAPPALDLSGWMNTDGQPLDWEALKGKVVVLDFWGTW